MLALIAGVIVVFFALGLGYYLLNSTLDNRKQELADAIQQREMVEAQAAGLQQYEQLATERAQKEAVIQGIYAGRTLVADILDALSLVVPETVWFQNLNLTAGEPTAGAGSEGATSADSVSESSVSIEGQTYSFEDVAQFLVRLELVPALSEIKLTTAGSGDQTGEVKSFSITAAVGNIQDPDTPLPFHRWRWRGCEWQDPYYPDYPWGRGHSSAGLVLFAQSCSDDIDAVEMQIEEEQTMLSQLRSSWRRLKACEKKDARTKPDFSSWRR
jgi:Tfp pilus assembly protein PilN